MGIYFDSKSIANVLLGTTRVSKIYYGEMLVWPVGPLSDYRITEDGTFRITVDGLYRTTALTFYPTAMFTHGEVGAVYDWTDFSTLAVSHDAPFSNTNTITGPGSPVGLIMDKSQGLKRSVLHDYGDTGSWTAIGTTPPIVDGNTTAGGLPCRSVTFDSTMTPTYAGCRASAPSVGGSITANKLIVGAFDYRISRPLVGGERVVIYFPNGGGMGSRSITSDDPANEWISFNEGNGFYKYTTQSIPLTCYLAGAIETTPVTVYIRQGKINEVLGNHAYQNTASARPTLVRMPVSGRRNLLLYTEELSNSTWTKGGATVMGGQDDATGGQTATLITEDTTNSIHRAYQGSNSIAGTNYWIKFKAKPSGRDWVCFLTNQFSGPGLYAYVNVTTGAVSNVSSGLSVTAEPSGNGFYAIKVVGTGATTGSRSVAISLGPASGAGVSTYAGDGTSGIVVCDIQMATEDGNYQKVTNAFDVTEAGVKDHIYLQGDGVDDSLIVNLPSNEYTRIYSNTQDEMFIQDEILTTDNILKVNQMNSGMVYINRPITADETTKLLDFYKLDSIG